MGKVTESSPPSRAGAKRFNRHLTMQYRKAMRQLFGAHRINVCGASVPAGRLTQKIDEEDREFASHF